MSAEPNPFALRSAPDISLEELKARPVKPGQASFYFFDNHFQHNAVKVLPGEYFVTNENVMLITVLGSCIAACLWDSRVGVGGMNHFMLPEGDSNDMSGRYGSYAMELQAKIFGGGRVISSFTNLNVGERNTEFVRDYLRTERIPVVSEDVLDIFPRKVVFFGTSGKAMVKRLAHTQTDAIAAQEVRGNAASVVRATRGGSVDIFGQRKG